MNFLGCPDIPNLNFRGIGTTTTPTVAAPLLVVSRLTTRNDVIIVVSTMTSLTDHTFALRCFISLDSSTALFLKVFFSFSSALPYLLYLLTNLLAYSNQSSSQILQRIGSWGSVPELFEGNTFRYFNELLSTTQPILGWACLWPLQCPIR